MTIPWYAIAAGGLALLYAIILVVRVMIQPSGSPQMRSIAKAIQEGAQAYLHRQAGTVSIFALIVFGVLYLAMPAGEYRANLILGAGFLTGAMLSGLAGYIGMSVSVRANVRTTEAAKKGLKAALSVAFQGGAITGMIVSGFALLGVSGAYLVLTEKLHIPVEFVPELLIGFGFGASLISLFARVGGGIFTKAADVGADLVGKVEKGIPEDDPRNPAVIADNVGDNVGDCAGMGADLFETYAVTLIAAMILAASVIKGDNMLLAIEYPMALGAIAIVASIIGTFFVRLKGKNIMGALYKGMIASGIISAIGFFFITKELTGELYLFFAAIVGLVVTLLLNIITEWYTSTKYSPVKSISKASETGAGTNLITGLAVGLKSTAAPLLVIVAAIVVAYLLGERSSFAGNGIYGIAIAAVAMLSTTGMVIATDSYGPITDNAGGIAEMANLPKEVRNVTDPLDAVGNTTKAVTKGYAIGSAALAALVLFQAYTEKVSISNGSTIFDINDYRVLIGLFLGGLLPFIFSAFCMEAVGKAAGDVVSEVRRQFNKIKGIMSGKEKPLYGRCVDIVTKGALREMILPGLLAVISPVAVGFILGPQVLGGLLAGSIVTGLLIALQMATGGAAWDNAKKLIEEGHFGGKGSEAHKAAVVGDTVGDPFKDTAGPAINALLKVMNTIALIIAPLLAFSILS